MAFSCADVKARPACFTKGIGSRDALVDVVYANAPMCMTLKCAHACRLEHAQAAASSVVVSCHHVENVLIGHAGNREICHPMKSYLSLDVSDDI